MTRLIGWIGARFIYALIWLFGRTHRRSDIAWLMGPLGGKTIGDTPYRDVAAEESLAIERDAKDGGLVRIGRSIRDFSVGGLCPAEGEDGPAEPVGAVRCNNSDVGHPPGCVARAND